MPEYTEPATTAVNFALESYTEPATTINFELGGGTPPPAVTVAAPPVGLHFT